MKRFFFLFALVLSSLLLFTYCNLDEVPDITQPPLKILEVSGISPNHGQKGDTITISGKGFGSETSEMVVHFTSNVTATIIAIDSTEIQVTVPLGADTGPIRVERTADNESVQGPSFIYDRPSISNFSPERGRSGDILTIKGENFGLKAAEIQVDLNGVEATLDASPTDKELKVVIPERAGSGTITVEVSGYSAATDGFEFLLSGTVSTFAGSGVNGHSDGPPNTAQFWFPYGLAVDEEDNIYVGDLDNHRIRRISPDGTVSTIAGTGTSGFINGIGSAAKLSGPTGMDIDNNGNLIFSDFFNHAIRKVGPGPSYQVSTVAGNGENGYQNGFGSQARFNFPVGIVVDANNNILVADRSNHTIRQITAAGSVSTFAGDGTSGDRDGDRISLARLSGPECIIIAPNGDIYFTDSGNHKVKVIRQNGAVLTLAGNGVGGHANGNGTAAQFNAPIGIDIGEDGHLFIADRFNNKIRVINPSGYTYDLAGDGSFGYQDGPGLQSKISGPFGLVLDTKGNVFVASYGNDNIRKIEVY